MLCNRLTQTSNPKSFTGVTVGNAHSLSKATAPRSGAILKQIKNI